MRGRFLLLIILGGVLAGCAANELYRPYTLRHPITGGTVTCGHWIWAECLVYNYERHGYQRVQESP
jgi:hypothetical protein